MDAVGLLLPKEQREELVENWTDLAKKYGHPTMGWWGSKAETVKTLRNTGKSGFTPVTRDHVGGGANSFNDRLEDCQRTEFFGFTARELELMEALTPLLLDEMEMGQRNPIHPVFEKSNWYNSDGFPKLWAPAPILGDSEGFWDEMMLPSLRLASRVLWNPGAYSRLDGLLMGTHNKTVPKVGDPYYVFKCRRPEVASLPREHEALAKKILEMEDCVGMELYCGYEKTLPYRAFTKDGVRIFIAYEQLQPLVRDDLTDVERLATQLRFASTLIHEFVHAAWMWIRGHERDELRIGTPGEPMPLNEPYFERETINELGHSFEQSVWGGECEDLCPIVVSGGPGFPGLGFCKTNWPSKLAGDQTRILTLRKGEKDMFSTYDRYPVPGSWVGNMFRQSTWEVLVRQYGAKATAMGPLTFGTRIEDGKDNNYMELLWKGDISEDSAKKEYDSIMVDDSMSTDEQDAANIENTRRLVAARIRDSLHKERSRTGRGNVATSLSASAKNCGGEPPDEEEHPEPQYDCPRWEEIRQYLVNNAKRLAISTMGMISEPLFLRYIRDCGGLNITPLELRNFLGVSNERGELFLYESFPGHGTVTKIKAGWPLDLPNDPTWGPSGPGTARGVQKLIDTIAADKTQELIYKFWGEQRDISIEFFRQFIRRYRKDGAPDWDEEDFASTVIEAARTGSNDFKLGPEGIIRFTYQIDDDWRHAHTSKYMQAKVRLDRDAAKTALRDWRTANDLSSESDSD